MNIKKKHPVWRLLLPILLTVCYWCVMVMLAIHFSGMGAGGGTGSGWGKGRGSGSGDGNSLLGGTGAASSGKGEGASDVEAGGKIEAKGVKNAEGAVVKKTDTPALANNDSDKRAAGADGEDISLDIVSPDFNIGIPNMKPSTPVGPKETVPVKGKVVLTGSEAGKLKGFFGSGGVSGNVLFVLDVSSSMIGTTPEGMRRIDLLKRELKKVLEEKKRELSNSDKGTKLSKVFAEKFMIITFSCTTTYFPADKKMLSFKREKDLDEAIQYVDTLTPGGGTNMWEAWQDFKPLLKPKAIDWIYLLTDGEFIRQNELLQDAKGYRQRFKTFSLGLSSKCLEDLAKQHRGTYHEIY